MNRTVRAAAAVMVMFLVIEILWAAIGYVYTGNIISGALVWGGAVVAAGWVIVGVGVTGKVVRLKSRRRRSGISGGE